jgi:DNA uptake protein ComE-like DNA-binding protein
MAKAATKTRVTKAQVIAHRTKAVKDYSPVWTDCESMDANQFLRHWHGAMQYYRMEFSGKDLKPAVIKWMTSIGCTKEDIQSFKKTKDNRCSLTMGSIASCLLRGMPAVRADFNDGKDTAAWLRNAINDVIEQGKNDEEEVEAVKEDKLTVVQPSIQERVRDAAYAMTTEIEDAYEVFANDPENFDPKAFKVLNLLKGKEAKAAHARFIKEFYARELADLQELASGTKDPQLVEGYKHLTRKQVKNLISFLEEIANACTMLMQEAKVNRKPRKTKAVSKDKVVAKLKFKKQDEPLKLVSINPADIIGAKELWIFNTKTRKLGKYVAQEYMDLGVKGTTITGFSETQSICKTLRKPEEKLKEFKAAGKVALRKFLDDINATDTRMNGRINEETVLLKVA